MKEFKIRCSEIDKVMTNDRSGKNIGQTSLSYCEEWVKKQIYGREKEISTKYMRKGLMMEDEAIDMTADYLKLGLLIKNEQNFSNDFMTGTPDVITNDFVIDTKCSWDCFSFPLFDKEIKNKAYIYQLQGYMALTGKRKAVLSYCLTDTPMNEIEKEAYYYCKNNGYDELDSEILDMFINKMTYSKIPMKYRIKTFEIQRDDEIIRAIESRVIQCREYIATLIK